MPLADHLEKAILFKRIIAHGSLSRASRRLGISQPALSRTLAILEDACGGVLAVRSREGLRPTEFGLELLDLVERVDTEVARFDARRERTRGEDVLLRFGTYESIAIYLFPKFIRAHGTTVTLSLGMDSSINLERRLAAGEFDAIISVNPTRPSTFHVETLFSDVFGFYVASKPALTTESARTLLDRGIFVPSACGKDNVTIDTHLRGLGVDTRKWMVCQSFEPAKALCLGGVGLTVMPVRVAQDAVAAGHIVEVRPPRVPARFGGHEIAFSCLTRRRSDSALAAMRRELVEFARSYAGLSATGRTRKEQ